jgi:two-component system sensor histidine kinase DesK
MRLLPRDSEHGWTPYLWLIYIGPFAVFPFFEPRVLFLQSRALTLVWWAAGFAAFLVLYFRSYWVDGSRRLRLIVAIALLGALMSAHNPGGLMFFVYAAGFVGGAAAPSRAGLWIGGLTVSGVTCAALSRWEPWLLISGVAIMTPLIGFVNLHYSETRRRDASLKLAQEEIARVATMAERERIARDLHDLLGQTLSVIVLKSELAAKLVARDPERAAVEIREVERVSRDALTEVRRAVRGFRGASLADELLRARAVLQSAGLQVEVDAAAPSINGIGPDIEHSLAMILREAVTNVMRHAKATHCRISLSRADGELVLRVEDDGVGGQLVEGAGLDSIRARTREIGGALVTGPTQRALAGSSLGRGMTISVRVPVSPPS